MFINSFSSISPAGILDNHSKCDALQALQGEKVVCIEPDYTDLIPVMQLRRMSKPVRTGVAAAKLCMQHYKGFHPSSIHVGTAYGMLQDSESFLNKMIEQEELLLNPTAFIQSTHNTVSGQIALSIGCNAHNMTYVHNGHSFENALLDASLLLEDAGSNDLVLVGAVEELTETSYTILKRFDVYGDHTIASEGATFFGMSKGKQDDSLAELLFFEMFRCKELSMLNGTITELIAAHNVLIKENDRLVHNLEWNDVPSVFNGLNAVNYMLLNGKYATAAAFGLSYTVMKLQEQNVERCWLLNNFGAYYSLMLVSKA